MAKLMWVTNTTTWYEYELSPEQVDEYNEDPDAFIENNDVFGEGVIAREKVLEDGEVEFFDDDEDEEDEDDYDEEDD
jgi:hypothetical protein